MRKLPSVIRFLERSLETICGAIFIVLIVVVFFGVVDRSIFKTGVPWIEELSRFLLTWLSLLAIALSVSKNQHYVVDIFDPDKLPGVMRILVDVLATTVIVAASLPMLVAGYEVAKLFSMQHSASLQIPGVLLHGGVPVCFSLCAVLAILRMLTRLRQPVQ
jgi:TRAP-type C4-dicarboxylate transport system permease small subunit